MADKIGVRILNRRNLLVAALALPIAPLATAAGPAPVALPTGIWAQGTIRFISPENFGRTYEVKIVEGCIHRPLRIWENGRLICGQ